MSNNKLFEKVFNTLFIKTDNESDMLFCKDIKIKYKEMNNGRGTGEKLFIAYLIDDIGCKLDTSNKSKHKLLMIKLKDQNDINEELEDKDELITKYCNDFMDKYTKEGNEKVYSSSITSLYNHYCSENNINSNRKHIHNHIKNILGYKESNYDGRFYNDFMLSDYGQKIFEQIYEEKKEEIKELKTYLSKDELDKIYKEMFCRLEGNKIHASIIKKVFKDNFNCVEKIIVDYLRDYSVFKQDRNNNYIDINLTPQYNPINVIFDKILIKTNDKKDKISKSIIGKSYKELNGSSIDQTKFYKYIENDMNVEIDKHGKIYYGVKLLYYCNKQKNQCLFEFCNKKATYGNNSTKIATLCNIHKTKEMVSLYNYCKCLYKDCDKYARFNKTGKGIPFWCKKHAEEHEENIRASNDKCINDDCKTRGKYIYDGYCSKCFYNGKNIQGLKERYMFDKLMQLDNSYDYIFNTCITDDCSLKPDILINFSEYVIIIEIDENEHTHWYYGNKQQEEERIETMQKSIGKDMFVIRINPDKYKINDNEFKGILLKDAIIDEYELNKRVQILLDTINEFKYDENDFTKSSIKYKYLFYSDK